MSSMFAKYRLLNAATLSAAPVQEIVPADNPEVVVVPVVDDKPGEITDPLDGVEQAVATESLAGDDEFAAQREQRNADMDRDAGLESLTAAVSAAQTQSTETQSETQEAGSQAAVEQTTEQTGEATLDGTVQTAAPTQEVTQEVTQTNAAVVQDAPVVQDAAAAPAVQEATVDLDTPVDGTNDDLTVKTTDTDVEVPTGDHGEEPEISGPEDDIEVDADDSTVDFDQELDQLDQESFAVEGLMQEIGMLADTSMAIENFGFNPTAAGIMKATGLLNGTALESLGLESISFTGGTHPESQLAIESLGEKIKEKAAQLSAKVLNIAKNSGEKIMAVLNPLWNKIEETTKSLTSAAWDKTKMAGATVRAHPFATVAAVIAAVAAVAGIVAFMASGAPASGAKVDAMKSFLGKVAGDISKIKFPGGTIKAAVNSAGTRVVTTFVASKDVAKAVAADSLGWTANSVKVMQGQLGRAWNLIKHAWSALGTRAIKLAGSAVKGYETVVEGSANATIKGASKVLGNSTAGTVGSHFLGGVAAGIAGHAYVTAIVGAVLTAVHLTRFVVVSGLKMIAATLRAIMPHTAAA